VTATITLAPGQTSSSAPPLAPPASDPCPTWFGGDVAILVCDPSVLRQALAQGTIGSAPDAQIELAGRSTGGGRGVAQAVGAPLHPGESASIQLPFSGTPTIFVRWIDATGAEQVAEQTVTSPASRSLQVDLSTGGPPSFRLG
jgi:hypothetical protein